MVSLVEHITCRQERIIVPRGGQRHDQRVIRDHQIRVTRLAGGAFDVAFLPMRTCRVDAFAATVGQRACPRGPDQVGEPARKIAAHHVAVSREARPTREQTERDPAAADARQRAFAEPAGRFVEIEQAEIIFAPFTDDDLAGFFIGIWEKKVELAIDLRLKILGEGRQPNGAGILVDPYARRRDVAERFADARARFRQRHARRVFVLARLKGEGHARRVIGLLRPRLGPCPQKRREPIARLIRLDAEMAGRRLGRVFRPFGQLGPHVETRGPRRNAERERDRRAPRPAVIRHAPRDRRGFFGPRIVGPGQFSEKRQRSFTKRHGLIGQGCRHVEAGGGRQTSGRRQAELSRTHEGEKLQHVEGRERIAGQLAGRGGRVTKDRRRRAGAFANLFRFEAFNRAVGRQPHGFQRAGDQRGRVRQKLMRIDRRARRRHGAQYRVPRGRRRDN